MSKKENNKLIAEFMGYTVIQKSLAGNPIYDIPTDKGIGYVPELMKYDSSWDWLMPVVEKILDISFQDEGDAEDFYSIRDCIPDINHTYKAVVEFIKWLNQNKDE